MHLNRASSLRPQLVIAKIAEYYRAAVEADEGYAGVLSRNPYQRRGGRTYWGRMRPYTLEELGAVLPRGYRLMRQPCTAIGRNVGTVPGAKSIRGELPQSTRPAMAGGRNDERDVQYTAGTQ